MAFYGELLVTWPDDESHLIEFADGGIAVVPEATIETHERGVGDIEMKVVYDYFLGRLAVERLTVSAPPGEEVTGAGLRAVRVQELLVATAESMVYAKNASGEWESFAVSLMGGEWPEEVASDRELYAARVYGLARLANMPPLKTVALALEVSQSTATRIIARARKSGKLREPDRMADDG